MGVVYIVFFEHRVFILNAHFP